MNTPDIQQTLDAIEGSPPFQGSERLSRLLRLVVEHEMASPSVPLKAYTIATTALGRRPTFDPATDSIVRVEMARLRTALKLFYAAGPNVPAHIDIPKGTYKPVFRPVVLTADVQQKRRLGPIPALGRCCAAALVFAALLVLALLPRPWVQAGDKRQAPVVLVSSASITGAGDSIAPIARMLTTEMASELAAFSWFSVALRGGHTSDGQRTSGSSPNRGFYSVDLNVAVSTDRFSATTKLINTQTGEILWRQKQEGPFNGERDLSSLAAMVKRSASELGQSFGALNKAEVARGEFKQNAGEYDCFLKLRRYIGDYRPEDWNSLKECASTDVGARETPQALMLAVKAMVEHLEARWYNAVDRKLLLATSNAHAEAAYQLHSELYIVDSMAMRSRACLGDRQGAEEIADRIIQSRAADSSALTDVSFVEVFLLGNERLGLALLEKAHSMAVNPHRSHAVTPALIALRQGDENSAKRLLGNVASSHFPVGLVLGLATSNSALEQERITKIKVKLRESGFDSDAKIMAIVDNECWTQDIKALVRPKVLAALTAPMIALP